MKTIVNILSLKKVPDLFWTAPTPFTIRPPAISILFLLLGLIVFGFGHAILFAANLGVSPWIVLSQGITVQTGWSIGWTIIAVSVLVLLLWLPLKQVPGPGTIINFLVVAAVIEVSINFLPTFEHILAQSVQALIGIIFIAMGTGIYLIANLGPGPRDGLMTGLQKVTDLPLAFVRKRIGAYRCPTRLEHWWYRRYCDVNVCSINRTSCGISHAVLTVFVWSISMIYFH